MTIGEALQQAQARGRGQLDAPELDARWLLEHVLGRTSDWLVTHADQPLPAAAEQHYEHLLAQRLTGKPLAYLLGRWEFYGRDFLVDERVLIPRPATEHLVPAALAAVKRLAAHKKRPLRVADIGTGSGCVAITLALECPPGLIDHLFASDISPQALAVARANASRHGVAERISFLAGDMLAPLALRQAQGKPAVDLIVSNPPYVPAAELDQTAPKTPDTIGLTFEPRQALDGGPDGHRYVRLLTAAATPAIIETTGGQIIYSGFSSGWA